MCIPQINVHQLIIPVVSESCSCSVCKKEEEEGKKAALWQAIRTAWHKVLVLGRHHIQLQTFIVLPLSFSLVKNTCDLAAFLWAAALFLAWRKHKLGKNWYELRKKFSRQQMLPLLVPFKDGGRFAEGGGYKRFTWGCFVLPNSFMCIEESSLGCHWWTIKDQIIVK